jgi:hypothetical protein
MAGQKRALMNVMARDAARARRPDRSSSALVIGA